MRSPARSASRRTRRTGAIDPLTSPPRAGRDDSVRDDPAVSALRTARVVPLVTTRALREPLDYLQPEGIELAAGDVVHVPLAGRNVRGVVVEAGGPSRHTGKLALV